MKEIKEKINLIRTETWLGDDFDDIHLILEEAINDFVEKQDEIINIQVVENGDGTKRFWIYIKSK